MCAKNRTCCCQFLVFTQNGLQHQTSICFCVLCELGHGVLSNWIWRLPFVLLLAGLDHSRPLIHENCKKLLLNLLLVLSAHNDHFAVARILLSNKAVNEDTALTLPNAIAAKDNFVGASFFRLRG